MNYWYKAMGIIILVFLIVVIIYGKMNKKT